MEVIPATVRNLRVFGFAFVVVFALLAVFSQYVWRLESASVWVPVFLVLAGLFLVVTALAPNSLRPVYGPWVKGGFLLGSVMTLVLMTALFVIVVPVFSLVRLKDPLRMRQSRDPTESFWEPHRNSEPTIERFGRPF